MGFTAETQRIQRDYRSPAGVGNAASSPSWVAEEAEVTCVSPRERKRCRTLPRGVGIHRGDAETQRRTELTPEARRGGRGNRRFPARTQKVQDAAPWCRSGGFALACPGRCGRNFASPGSSLRTSCPEQTWKALQICVLQKETQVTSAASAFSQCCSPRLCVSAVNSICRLCLRTQISPAHAQVSGQVVLSRPGKPSKICALPKEAQATSAPSAFSQCCSVLLRVSASPR